MAEAAKDFLTYLKNRQDGRLNLVAVGRTGDGKSSSLNSILKLCSANPILFKCYGGAVSITKACDERVVDVFGLNCRLIFRLKLKDKTNKLNESSIYILLRLVDTMGLFDTDFTTEQKKTASIMNVPDLMDDHKVVLMELSKVRWSYFL